MAPAADITKAASAAAAKRTAKRKGKSSFGYTIAIGVCSVATLFAVYLAATGPSAKSKPRVGSSQLDNKVSDDSVIKDVNRGEATFTAAASPFFNGWNLAHLKYGFDGTKLSNMVGMAGAVQFCEQDDSTEGGVIPINFDARDKWPSCKSKIYDSGNCTSSYAIAAASSLSMRFCAADEEKFAGLRLSPQQILSCDKKSLGCRGGGVDSVWAYVQRRGLYPEECLPYKGEAGSPCKTDCDASKKLKSISHCVMRGVKEIKRDILAYGPLVAPIRLLQEFLVYQGGIFNPTDRLSTPVYGSDGKPILHALTIIGWGKSEGVAFWIVENSWGTSWGEQGYARVAVGALMEEYVVAGYPETPEAIAKAEAAKKLAEERKEVARKERMERDARIAEAKKARAEQTPEDLDDNDDFDVDADLDELDDIEENPQEKDDEGEM